MPNMTEFKTTAEIRAGLKHRNAAAKAKLDREVRLAPIVNAAISALNNPNCSVTELLQKYATYLARQQPVVTRKLQAHEALVSLAQQLIDEDPAKSQELSQKALVESGEAERLTKLHTRWKLQEWGLL